MFGHQFYPTPTAVINKMIEPYRRNSWRGSGSNNMQDIPGGDLEDKTILDPSAGKGDILTHIQKILEHSDRIHKADFYAIELDTNLQAIIREKGIPVLATDFLSYEPDMLFDVILMNPPFDNGVDHLLKAVEIAHNTDIVCLLNAETISNPYTDKRKQVLELIENYGSFELLGPVFEHSERKTNVEVALVRLKIQSSENDFDFSFLKEEKERVEFDETFVNNELIRDDKIGNLMIYFDQAKASYKKYIEAQRECEHRIKTIITGGSYFKFEDYEFSGSPLTRFNKFSKKMKLEMWRQVINKLGLERYLTHSIRRDFEGFIQQQANMAFTKENVTAFINMLLMNGETILNKAIVQVFDELTSNYYSENRLHVEGWKTNDRYKVNRRVIAPCYVQWGEYMSQYDLSKYGDTFSLSFHGRDKYTDIDKVMSFISGKAFEQITTIESALQSKFKELGCVGRGSFDNVCESTFFEIKFYKKGTVHLKFKDKWLWDEFNMRACAGKNWLPDGERTKWEAKRRKKSNKEERRQLQLTG